MLHWFFPAWAMALIIRSPVINRRMAAWMVRGVLYSAGVLALIGMAEFLSHQTGRWWRMPVGAESFASFGYANHAAAYFVLLGAGAAGLLFREVFRRDRPPRTAYTRGLLAILMLCLVAANLSLSRTGIILAWTVSGVIIFYALLRGWRLFKPAARVRLAIFAAGTLLALYFAVSGTGGRAIRDQFTVVRRPVAQMIPAWRDINLDLSDRPRLWDTAWRIFKDHPGFGIGGWGFRHMAALYLPESLWKYLQHPGRANVHSDPLQFLVEFGVVGSGLMLLCLVSLMAPLWGPGVTRGAVFTMTTVGLAAVSVFSIMDLPFRCPAILWTWAALLAVLPKLTPRAPRAGGQTESCVSNAGGTA